MQRSTSDLVYCTAFLEQLQKAQLQSWQVSNINFCYLSLELKIMNKMCESYSLNSVAQNAKSIPSWSCRFLEWLL